MNKKLIGNLILLALVITLGFSFIDFGGKARTHEEAISDYISANLEEDTQYRPIVFKRIDENMLMNEPGIHTAFATIIDSIHMQLSMLSTNYISLDFQNSLEAADDYRNDLNLENLAGYLPLDAQMKRQLKQASTLSEEKRAALYQEETRMHQAISDLNAALGRYNLSLFSLNLGADSNPIYWHQYQLNDEAGSSVGQAVFELEKESGEILSFKEI